ncbi:MAG: hypothetical protein PHH06_02465 [Candidatus Gracilibacteria bacterium]|nr:hypothetical protein [Candidatus Gracilibacteria bacterium]
MSENKKDNLKYALCYIPFFSIVIFFIEDKKTDELRKHIKYAIFLLLAYILLYMFLGWMMGAILSLLYIIISVFLGYKAYNGENVDLEIIDDIEKKIKDKM